MSRKETAKQRAARNKRLDAKIALDKKNGVLARIDRIIRAKLR